jgi:ABC-type multidrug transport system ATPase subunit
MIQAFPQRWEDVLVIKEGAVSEGKVIEFVGVSMTFGDTPAVEDLTARVEPGRVTAFLGPNGAGKTTTLRMLLGDLRATNGTATIGGTEYTRIAKPASSIGAVMSITPLERARRKTAIKYLTRSARRIGVGASRAREVLQIVGLGEMGDMRIGSLSLGMKHRLAVAEALLGDPGVLVFDEPANGLDPEGIRWIRLLMRGFADEGRTVLMSSHLLSEVEQVADALLILNEGRVLFEGPIELLAEAEGGMVTVDADDRAALAQALTSAGFPYRVLRSGLAIDDTTTSEIGALAKTAGIALTTLTHRGPTLEDVYLQIIDGSWVAPARTAALAPAPLSFDDVLSGSPDASGAEDSGPDADPSGAEDEPGEIPGLGAATVAVGAADAATTDDDSSADAAGDGETHDESALADGFPAASFPIPVESGEADALAAGSAFPAAIFPSPANTGDAEADDSASAAASVSATGDRNDSETDASSFPAANLPVADAADSTADHGSTEGDAQPEETTPAARREDDDAPRRRAGAAAALAGGSLPGIAGLAGLANGLRSDDEESDEELPEGLVSPGLAAAVARAGEIEAQMSDIEADIETQEVRAENVDAVAQIETMLEPRGADGATATETVIEVDPFAGEGLDGVDGDGD